MSRAPATEETRQAAGVVAAPELSVVILCYRAEEYVPVFVAQVQEALKPLALRHELVLVANYDAAAARQDRTPAIVTALAAQQPGITVVAQPKQGMMGWDMRSGLEAATGQVVAVIDGDGQMPAADLVAVYRRLVEGGFDLVKTYRTTRHDGWQRRTISSIYNVLLRLLFPCVNVRDANSKPKILTRQALDRLRLTENGWFIDAEIVIRASQMGFRIGEVPTVFYSNERRASFVHPDAVIEFARQLVRYRFGRPKAPRARG